MKIPRAKNCPPNHRLVKRLKKKTFRGNLVEPLPTREQDNCALFVLVESRQTVRINYHSSHTRRILERSYSREHVPHQGGRGEGEGEVGER